MRVRRAPCFSEYEGVTILQPEEFLTKVEQRIPELSGAPTFRLYYVSTVAICRKLVISRNGGAPNKRLYSRLNWEGLS
jgi:hypothetical protein